MGLAAVAAATIFAPGFSAPAMAQALVVGAYPANPPWENKREDGTFEGFEVDLVNEIGKRLGREIEIQDLGFQALFAATSSGRIDMAISSITITNERLAEPVLHAGLLRRDLGLAAKVDSGVSSLEDLAGKPVGALSTSTGEDLDPGEHRAIRVRRLQGLRRPAEPPARSAERPHRRRGLATSRASSSPSSRCRTMHVVERITLRRPLRHHDAEGFAAAGAT